MEKKCPYCGQPVSYCVAKTQAAMIVSGLYVQISPASIGRLILFHVLEYLAEEVSRG